MTLRQTCAAIVLSLSLGISVFAGTIDCPGVVAPPPPPSETSTLISPDISSTLIVAIVGLIS